MRTVTSMCNTQCLKPIVYKMYVTVNCISYYSTELYLQLYFLEAYLGDLLLRRVDLLGNAAQLEVGLGEDGLHVGPQVQQAPLQAQLPLLIFAFLINIIIKSAVSRCFSN
jgi:hypothetical protein